MSVFEPLHYRFPSKEDAAVSVHGLDSCLEHVEGLVGFDAFVQGTIVCIEVTVSDRKYWPGVERALEAWAGSSDGYAV